MNPPTSAPTARRLLVGIAVVLSLVVVAAPPDVTADVVLSGPGCTVRA